MKQDFTLEIEKLNLEQTRKLLKNIIRVVPQKTKELIEEIVKDTLGENDPNLNKEYLQEIQKKIQFYQEKFTLIEEAELYFSATGYEDYSDHYHGWYDNWVWEYTDPSNIGIIIDDAYQFAIQLIHTKKYQEATTILDLILFTNYHALDEDGGDFIELELDEMCAQQLIHVPTKELCLYIIYAAYQGNLSSKRASIIYTYISNSCFKGINIPDAFQLGIETIKEEEQFWEDFLKLLATKPGNQEYKLFKEILKYTNKSLEIIFKLPQAIYQTHPQLFLDYLIELKERKEYQKIVSIGAEICEKLNPQYKVRSKIALLVGDSYSKLGFSSKINFYLYQAFVSDSSSINLLRIILRKDCLKEYKKDILKIIQTHSLRKENHTISESTELLTNEIDEKSLRYLKFFLGDFEDVIKYCQKHNQYLGWSGNFIEDAINLLLLYLYDDLKITPSIQKIITSIFHQIGSQNDSLYFLTDEEDISNIEIEYLKIFRKWKEQTPMNKEYIQEINQLLKEKISKRVDAIVSNQKRYSYQKAAILVGAYADILKSRNLDEGNQFIENYHKKYPRHSAFRTELKKL